MEITQDIINSNGIDSAYIEAPFDKAKEALEKDRYEIISLKQNAMLRIQEGKDSNLSRNGNYIRESFVYNTETRLWYLTKNSPIMEYPVEATNAHRNAQEYFLTNEQVQRALEDSVEIKDRKIPTNRFGESGLTVFAFEEQAQPYGLFLLDIGIKEMPILLPDYREKPFVRPLWFRNLGVGSGLGGNSRLLHFDVRMRGVRDAVGVANAKNFSSGNLDTYVK